MERCDKTSKVSWMSLAIYGGALLRFIMEDMGCGLDNGMVVITDDEIQARQYIQEYSHKTGNKGCQVTSWKRKRIYPPNFCCAFMKMKKGIVVDEVEDFLSEKGFLPIIVSGGLLPDYLREGHYIFRLKKTDLKNIKTEEFITEMKCFQTYVTGNVVEVCKTLEESKSSIAVVEYEGEEKFRCIYNFLMGVGLVYATYLRKSKTERVVCDFLDDYKKETLERLSLIPEFATGEVLKETISSLVWGYLFEEDDTVITSLDNINTEAEMAIKESRVILFDEKRYCFSPKLLMRICKPLLQTVSETELKRRLKEEGIIYCNSADYTVKQNITNVYGITVRPRFFWVNKEALLSPDNLCIEDMFYQENREENE